MTDRFWTEGPRRVCEAAKRRRADLDRLAERLRQTDAPDEGRRLEGEIRELLAEYSPSEREIGESLFLLR